MATNTTPSTPSTPATDPLDELNAALDTAVATSDTPDLGGTEDTATFDAVSAAMQATTNPIAGVSTPVEPDSAPTDEPTTEPTTDPTEPTTEPVEPVVEPTPPATEPAPEAPASDGVDGTVTFEGYTFTPEEQKQLIAYAEWAVQVSGQLEAGTAVFVEKAEYDRLVAAAGGSATSPASTTNAPNTATSTNVDPDLDPDDPVTQRLMRVEAELQRVQAERAAAEHQSSVASFNEQLDAFKATYAADHNLTPEEVAQLERALAERQTFPSLHARHRGDVIAALTEGFDLELAVSASHRERALAAEVERQRAEDDRLRAELAAKKAAAGTVSSSTAARATPTPPVDSRRDPMAQAIADMQRG